MAAALGENGFINDIGPEYTNWIGDTYDSNVATPQKIITSPPPALLPSRNSTRQPAEILWFDVKSALTHHNESSVTYNIYCAIIT